MKDLGRKDIDTSYTRTAPKTRRESGCILLQFLSCGGRTGAKNGWQRWIRNDVGKASHGERWIVERGATDRPPRTMPKTRLPFIPLHFAAAVEGREETTAAASAARHSAAFSSHSERMIATKQLPPRIMSEMTDVKTRARMAVTKRPYPCSETGNG